MPLLNFRWLPTLLALLSGGLLVFAYPGWNFEPAVWLWLLPLLTVIWPLQSNGSPIRAGRLGLLTGFAFFIPNLFWVRHSSRVIGGALDDRWIGWGHELLGFAAVLGLSLYGAIYFALWAWFTHRFARPDPERLAQATWQESTLHSLRCAILAAAAWTACEWLRGFVILGGFGWNGLGVALHKNLVLVQAADLVGVTGLSFLPVLVACAGWNTLIRLIRVFRGQGNCRTRLDFTLALVLLLAVAGYGMFKLSQRPNQTEVVRAVLVQPNVAQVDAWSGRHSVRTYQRLSEFTRLYAENRNGQNSVDLVIWPESALPIHLHGHPEQYGLPEHESYFNHLLSLGSFSLLTGTEIHLADASHVSAVLMHGTYQQRQEYHKMHLVPFGEYLPLRQFPPFSLLKQVLPGDFTRGSNAEPLLLNHPQVQIIPLICFEDTVGRLARRFVRDAPQVIVNISNDGWFLQSIETEMHLANALFRCIELRRPMCRASNTGVTCFIDAQGRVTSRLVDPHNNSTFVEGCLPGEVHVSRQPEYTLYARWGDWFPLSALCLCLLAMLLQKQTRKQRLDSQ
jgi:apolipoprotein N-acyltransferase